MDTLVTVAIVLGVLLVYVVPMVITGLKGKQGMLLAGVFLHPVWWVGAIRLALPDSYWARRFYGPDKLARAGDRHARPPLGPPPDHITALGADDRT